jgi:hypothetical protein
VRTQLRTQVRISFRVSRIYITGRASSSRTLPSFIFFFMFFFTSESWPQRGLIVVVCFHVFKPASDHQNVQQCFPFLFLCDSCLRTLFLLSPSSLETFFRLPSEGLRRSESPTRRAYFLIASTLAISLPLFRSPYCISVHSDSQARYSAALHLMDKNPAHRPSSID